MAYEDLTPQERQVLQQSLLAPPPATFAAPGQINIDPQTRMEAQLGLLGPQGRFIEQLARQQDEAQREARSVQMAQTLQGISPLDPEYVSKVQTIAKSDPLAFNSGTVQQVLQLGQMAVQEERRAQQEAKVAQEEARRAAETAQAQTVASELLGGPPELLTQRAMELAKQYPGAAASGEFGRALQLGAQMEADQRRIQEEAKRTQAEQRSSQLAQSVLNLPAKTFTQSLRELIKMDPEAGRSPEVNNAINIREAEIREQQAKRGLRKERKAERQLGELQSQLDRASPEELDAFEAANPQLLPKVRPIVEARRKEYSDIENLVQDIPPYLVEGDKRPVRLPEAQKIASRFEKQLSPSMQKIKGLSNRLRANQLAQQISEIRSAAPPAEDGKRVLPSEEENNLSAELAELLGYRDTFTQVPDATIKLLKDDSKVLFGADAYERVVSPAVREQINRVTGKP